MSVDEFILSEIKRPQAWASAILMAFSGWLFLTVLFA